MSKADPEPNISLSTIFNIANIIKVVGVAVISFFIVWFNTNYASVEKHRLLEDRVFVLEQKITNSDKQMESMMTMLKNIDARISNLITPNGTVIYSDKILKMDSDIEIIKRDIGYVKEYISLKK